MHELTGTSRCAPCRTDYDASLKHREGLHHHHHSAKQYLDDLTCAPPVFPVIIWCSGRLALCLSSTLSTTPSPKHCVQGVGFLG